MPRSGFNTLAQLSEGKLMEALFEAQETTIEEMDALYRDLLRDVGTA